MKLRTAAKIGRACGLKTLRRRGPTPNTGVTLTGVHFHVCLYPDRTFAVFGSMAHEMGECTREAVNLACYLTRLLDAGWEYWIE